MKIEHINTLLIISLVLLVLFGVAGTGFVLLRDHVKISIEADLDRGQRVFEQARRSRSEKLLSAARSVSRESGLIAAALSSDIAAVRSKLEHLYSPTGADFMAVYLTTGRGGGSHHCYHQ